MRPKREAEAKRRTEDCTRPWWKRRFHRASRGIDPHARLRYGNPLHRKCISRFSLLPLLRCNSLVPNRAGGGIRTPDLLITNQLLYP
jgi:hypothetical protein